MNVCRICSLTTIGFVALMEPAFATPIEAPGPIAGIGLPALAVIGGAYWLGRKLLARKR